MFTKEADNTRKNNRCANFEALRIVIMLLIIIGHIMMYSTKLDKVGTVEYYITNAVRSFTMVAVNTFVLITGYFGTNRKWRKLLGLDLKVCFYTWLGVGLAIAFGIHKFNLIKDIQLFFPVITKQYWYITIYFVLCILSPYINTFLKVASREMLKKFIVIGAIVFYFIATICFLINANQIVMDAGYGIVNFVYLYCFGYYIRNYYDDTYNTILYIGIYFFACLGTYIVNLIMSEITGFYFDSMISYNTIFTLSGSVGLFMWFKQLRFKENRVIIWLAKHSLSVYLIHMCPFVGVFIFTEIMKVNQLEGYALGRAIIIFPLAIYLMCSIIDSVVEPIIIIFQRNCIRIILRIRNNIAERKNIL